VVDNFGVKYINKVDAEYLTAVLKQDYVCGTCYLGLTLDGDYAKSEVHLSLPGYIEKALVCFGHTHPTKPQDQPHPHTTPSYGTTIQYAKPLDETLPATKDDQKLICQVVDVLLYYARAVDSMLLIALSSLASAQAAPTQHTMTLIRWSLDYVATNPDSILTYKKSNMVLAVHSGTSYLSKAAATAESEAISSAPKILITQVTMEQYSTHPKY
jgi:hypothetical protein